MSGVPLPSARFTWDELASLAPIRAGAAEDAVFHHMPQEVAEPRTADETASILKWANAHAVAVAVRGGGSKVEWGNPPRALDVLVSTHALSRILEHAWGDMTATVEAGCTVADFQRALAEHGQRLAVDPLFPGRATIGGILATNDSGPLRTRFGSLRDLVIGITAALPDGTLARSGGKVVKNVAGYDLPKLFTGSLGTLGVVVQATFRLHPLPAVARTVSFQFASMKEANAALLALQDSTLVHTSLQIRGGHERPSMLDIRFEGIPASVETQTDRAISLAKGRSVESEADVWRAREELWMLTGTACICQFSVLPNQIFEICARLNHLAKEFRLEWRIVAQALGVGLLRIESASHQLTTAVGRLRSDIENAGGSLVLLRCPGELRSHMDAWGAGGSALPLMRRVKHQFDPVGIMNPGRFLGGI